MFAFLLTLIIAADTTKVSFILPPIYVEGKASHGIVEEKFPATYRIVDYTFISPTINFLSLPGVYPRSYLNMMGISIRGSGMEEVKVMFEGIPVKNPQNGYFDFSFLPSDIISSIEVLLTGNSSFYGYNSMGGIVNIMMPEGANFLSIGAGEDGYFSISGFKSTLLKGKFYLRAGAAYEFTPSEYTVNTSDLQMKIRNAGRKRAFAFIETGNSSFSGFCGIGTSTRGIPIIPGGYTTDRDSIFEKMLISRLSYKKFKLLIYRDWFTYKPEFSSSDLHETYSFHAIYKPFAFSKIELSREGITSISLGDHSRTSLSLAANYSLNLRWLMPIFSFSGDYWFETGELQKSFFTGISTDFGPYVSTSTGYRLPTYNDLYWPETPFAKGNPDLKDESLVEYELGFKRNFDFVTLSASRFWRHYKDLIKWAPGDDGKWRPMNLRNVSIYGVDGNLRLQFKFLKIAASGEFIDNVKSDVNLIYYPFFSWSLTGGIKWVSLNVEYIGERYERLTGPKKLPAVTLLNMFFRIPFKSVLISFDVTNVTNKYYLLLRGYPAPGREWHVKMKKKI